MMPANREFTIVSDGKVWDGDKFNHNSREARTFNHRTYAFKLARSLSRKFTSVVVRETKSSGEVFDYVIG